MRQLLNNTLFQLCAGLVTLQNQVCSAVNAAKPYCNNNACSDKPSTSCTTTGGSFTCTSDGLFPNPTDCKVYYECSGGVATELDCPSGYVFYVTKGLCRRQDTPAYCVTVDCSKTPNRIISFPGSPAYYAFCSTIPTPQVYMFKCLDEQNEVYDLTTGACTFSCKNNGLYVDRTDCNSYIDCSIVNGKYASTKLTCPKNYWFNNGSCVKESTPCTSIITTDPPVAVTTVATTLAGDTTLSGSDTTLDTTVASTTIA